MRFGSVCSGIEAASLAFGAHGWEAAWFSEIEPFPCAALAHHFPRVPNLGDMRQIADDITMGLTEAPDLLVGGTPCQAFSVAGGRASLADARGNLTLTFCEIADAIDDARQRAGRKPAAVFWENVPGVLNTKDNAFGCFLGQLAGEDCALVPPGGRWANAGLVLGPRRAVAWRVLDAQYFGLAQRRRRVFVVASARDGFDPGAVLLEFDGVRRDSPPRRGEGEDAAAGALCSSDGGCDENDAANGRLLAFGGNNTSAIDRATALNARGGQGRMDFESETFIAYGINARQDPDCWEERTGPLDTDGGTQADGLGAEGMRVRRLTPTECERLQGFPDGHTAVLYRGKPAADGPRYKAIGNSWAVACVEWIAERLTLEFLLS
jgi:DNA (cytosine-5)-methyltransferase 1